LTKSKVRDKGGDVRPSRLVAVVATTAVLVAAASIPVAGASVPTGSRGVTSDSIKVAGVVDASQFFKDRVEAGINARFNRENDQGGVSGRMLDYVETVDDKHDANTNLTEIRRLVQEEQVFAIVPNMTPEFGGPAAKFLEQQHVPFVGWGIAEAWCDNDYGYGFTGCIVPPASIPNTGDTWGKLLDKYFKAQGDNQGGKGKTAAVITEDNDTGKRGLQEIVFQAKKGGNKVVYQKAAVPAGQAISDYSPFVNDMLSSNNGGPPDIIYLVTAATNTLGLAGALKDAGYQGLITNAVGYDPALVQGARREGVFTQFDLPQDTENPAMQNIIEAFSTVGVSADKISQPALAAYFSADMFVQILKKVGKNLTPERFAKAASKFTYEIPGVIGPTKFPTAFKQGAPCGTLVQSDGTQYNIVVPYDCYTNYNYKTGKKLKY